MPETGQAAEPRREYSDRVETRREALATLQGRHRMLGNLRALVFVGGAALLYVMLSRQTLSPWWLLVPVLAFVAVTFGLDRAERRIAKSTRAVTFYEHGLERLDGKWAGRGETGARFIDDKHPYAQDLDLFGEASLFELLSQARTGMGEQTLAAWLKAPASPDVVSARQESVEELSTRLDLREDLAVLGEDARTGVHPNALIAWGEREALLKPSPFRAVAWVLSVFGAIAAVALVFYFAAWVGELDLAPRTMTFLRVYFLFIFVTFGFILTKFKKITDRILEEVDEPLRDLGLLTEVLRRLETERFQSQRMAALSAELDVEGNPPSRRIAKLDRLVTLIDSRRNAIFGVLAPFVLWDLHCSYTLEDWRRESGPALRKWLNAVGEMEALSSFAGFHYERPTYAFPEFSEASPYFEGEELAHPLLPVAGVVSNDVAITDELQVLVVSGSNMSGKSTLLRTIGVNTVLAQAGAPVRARRLRLSPLQAAASIRIQDSLREGASRFYAEITRLRLIMQLADGPTPVLFLIDEFLHGTNSHDRRIGAEAIVRGLVERKAIGLITTHDLALAHIADAMGAAGKNVHFEDHLEGGKMRFDYKMRPGIVEKSNAIELMRSIGLEV